MASAALDLIIRLRDDASAGISNIRSGLAGIAETAAGFALGGLLQSGVEALAGLGAESISVAGEFEAGMNRLASVTGDSLSQAGLSLDDFSAKFLELGAETQFSAAQAQDAAIALAKGGIPVADILGTATEATLGLAAAGELELGPAADIVAKQLGVWAETGVTAAQVADQMAQAANASTVDVDELAMGLANVGGTAKVAGVDFADLTQTMALIAPGFSSASDAGTSLATMIRGFQPTTGPATKAMQDLGLMTFNAQKALAFLADEGIKPASNNFQDISAALMKFGAAQGMSADKQRALVSSFNTSVFYDAEGAFVGMEEAARLLAGATGDLSEAEKVMAFSTIFGADAIRAASAVANAGQEGFNAMGEAMVNAGSAADQAAIKQQGFAFAMDSLKGTIETVQIVVGGALLPVLTDLLNNAIIPATNAFLTFAQNILTANDPIAALIAQIDTVLPGFQGIVDMISANIVPILSSLAAMLAAVVVPAFIAWAGAAVAAAGATIAALAPVIAPIAAIGAAVGLLVLAWQNDFGGIATFLTGWWEGTGRPIFEQLRAWLSTQLTAAIAALSAYWTNTLQPALQQVWSFIQANVIPLLVSLGGTVLTQLGQAVSLLANIWSTVLWPAIQTVAGWISGTLVPLLVSIGSVYLAAVGKAAELAAGVFKTIFLPPLQAVGDFISGTLGPALSSLGNTYLPPVKEGFGVVADVVKAGLNVALGNLKTILDGVRTWLGYVNDRIRDAIGFFGDLADSINSIEIPDWLQGQSPPPLADWLQYIAEAAQVAKDLLGGFGGTAQQLAGQIKGLSESLIDDAFSGTISLARAQVNAIKEISSFAGDASGIDQARTKALAAAQDLEKQFEAIDAQQAKIVRMKNEGASNDALTAEYKKLDALKAQVGVLEQQYTLAQQGVTAAQQQQNFLKLIAQEAQGNLAQALEEAQALEATDPKAAADFFKMRRDQIMELADIQKRMAEGTTDAEFQALARQRDLIMQAQQVERMQFEEELARRRQAQIDATQQIFDNIGGVLDTKERPVNDAIQTAWLNQLRDFTSLMQQGNMGIINFINALTQMPVLTVPGGFNAGPLGPNPAANITININGASGDPQIRALVTQGVQQGLAAAGINGDLRARGQ